MKRPVKAMYIAVAIGIAVAFLALAVDIVYVHIIQAAVFGYVLGVGYTYKCLGHEWDKIVTAQGEILRINTNLLERQLDTLLSTFGEQEEQDTVH
jgi:hypothetical protein